MILRLLLACLTSLTSLAAQATYYDKETGVLQNVNRNLDASSGRYLESDPIGLQSGLNTYAYVLNAPLIYFDPFGLQTFGIGIEPPAGAVSNGVLNPALDPGHTFAYLLDPNNQISAIVSVGPMVTITPFNKNAFIGGSLPAIANFNIMGTIQTYQWSMTQAQYQQCLDVFAGVQQNPGYYTPTNQCTSAAISVAQKCGIDIPNGISPIVIPARGVSFPGYSNSLPNPYGLQQQLNQTMTPQAVSGTTFQRFQAGGSSKAKTQ